MRLRTLHHRLHTLQQSIGSCYIVGIARLTTWSTCNCHFIPFGTHPSITVAKSGIFTWNVEASRLLRTFSVCSRACSAHQVAASIATAGCKAETQLGPQSDGRQNLPGTVVAFHGESAPLCGLKCTTSPDSLLRPRPAVAQKRQHEIIAHPESAQAHDSTESPCHASFLVKSPGGTWM